MRRRMLFRRSHWLQRVRQLEQTLSIGRLSECVGFLNK
jgi:hypothetical protein